MSLTSITVTGYHQEGSVTFYRLQISKKDESYELNRRFSDILRLHRALARHGSLFILPPRPPKYPTQLIQNEAFIRSRIRELNDYFQELVKVDLIDTHDGFLIFFASPNQ